MSTGCHSWAASRRPWAAPGRSLSFPATSCTLLDHPGRLWEPGNLFRSSAPESTGVRPERATSDTVDLSGRRDKYSDNPLIQRMAGNTQFLDFLKVAAVIPRLLVDVPGLL